MSAGSPTSLDQFNDAPPDRVVQALRACNAAPRFAAELVAGRPYPDVDTLVSRSEAVARSLPWDEVALALAAHPRIGERSHGNGLDAAWSQREQSGVDDDPDTRQALTEGNRAYEERFGRVFLICATGLSGADVLGALHTRLANDPETEAGVVAGELRKIDLLRLRRVLAP